MLASTLYVRVVPQDKDRGFMLLAGYDSSVVQRTALQYTTLTAVTRASLNAAIERLRKDNSAKEVKDCTAPAIQKKLAKLFGETPEQQVPATFSNMGVGHYLP
jgi:phosphoribosylaminoimidazole (AIR) synthetase